jgi:hypothetical protein
VRKQDAMVLSLAFAIVVTCVVYAIGPSHPVYHPSLHLWSWDAVPGTPSMKWYGRSLWGLVAGAAAWLAATMATRRWVRDGETSPPKLSAKWLSVVTLIVLVGSLVDTVIHEVSTWMR